MSFILIQLRKLSKYTKFFRQSAFTFAEMLIVIGIIGLIANMTLPTLIVNVNNNAISTAKEVMNLRILEAMDQMRASDNLTGYETADAFAREFGKYIKITKICDSSELSKCFLSSAITDNDSGKVVEVSRLSGSASIALDTGAQWPTSTVGVQFVNGAVAILTYRKDCTWLSPYEHISGEAAGCLAIIYDVNGVKGPNKYGQDIAAINAKLPLCAFEVGNICFSVFYAKGTISPIKAADCEKVAGIKDCSYAKDYWAGAAKLCEGRGNMASTAQLAKLATQIYGKTCGEASSCTGTRNQALATSMGLPTGEFFLWSSGEVSATNAYDRHFGPTGSARYSHDRGNSNPAVLCVSN